MFGTVPLTKWEGSSADRAIVKPNDRVELVLNLRRWHIIKIKRDVTDFMEHHCFRKGLLRKEISDQNPREASGKSSKTGLFLTGERFC